MPMTGLRLWCGNWPKQRHHGRCSCLRRRGWRRLIPLLKQVTPDVREEVMSKLDEAYDEYDDADDEPGGGGFGYGGPGYGGGYGGGFPQGGNGGPPGQW